VPGRTLGIHCLPADVLKQCIQPVGNLIRVLETVEAAPPLRRAQPVRPLSLHWDWRTMALEHLSVAREAGREGLRTARGRGRGEEPLAERERGAELNVDPRQLPVGGTTRYEVGNGEPASLGPRQALFDPHDIERR